MKYRNFRWSAQDLREPCIQSDSLQFPCSQDFLVLGFGIDRVESFVDD